MGCRLWGRTESDTTDGDLAAAAAILYCVCICIPHLLYPFLFDGRLGCFHVLTIVNSAAVNTGVHISFQSMVPLDICPGVGLLDHAAGLNDRFFEKNIYVLY